METAIANTVGSSAKANNNPLKEFLTMKLGREEYGIDIMHVQEIRSWERPTRIAGAPAHITGVFNLRGIIVPVLNLKAWLGFQPVDSEPSPVVIILKISGRVIGIVVDAVSDVLQIKTSGILPAPEISSNYTVNTAHVTGIASVDNRMIILMDIQSMISSPELGLIEAD